MTAARTYIGMICLLLALPLVAMAGEGRRILVLNADTGVERYRAAQEAFVHSLPLPVRVFDLAAEKGNRDAVQQMSTGPVDLVYCVGSKAYMAAIRHAPSATIVFSSILNWRRFPARDHTYGVSSELHPAMQMMLFQYVFPEVDRLGLIYSKQFNQEWVDVLMNEASHLGMTIVTGALEEPDQALSKLADILPRVDAQWLIADPSVIASQSQLKLLLDMCDRYRKPVFTYNRVFIAHGATLAVSVDDPTVGRQAALIAEDVLAGRPIRTAVIYPAGTHIVVNLKKGRQYQLRVNDEALGSVNQIIE